MFTHTQKRALHTTSLLLSRAKRAPLKIRPPITPTVKNFEVSDSHPLWQFFHDKKYLRTYEDLDNAGRSWTIPELRRKSFEDLHSLWYSCLKERNILTREIQVLQADIEQPDQQFMAMSDRVRETMWRIRHVLGERARAEENATELFQEQEQELLDEFREYYLGATKDEEHEIVEALTRMQYAVFGISEVIDENVVDKNFIKGVRYLANLKMERYGKDNEKARELLPITDVGEASIAFFAEHTEKAMNEAIDIISSYREEGTFVPKHNEISTLKGYLEAMANAA